MASINEDGKIVQLPPVSQNIPPNPLLGYSGGSTAPPSTAGKLTSGITQSTLAHQVLLHDQRCLVTGAISSQLQACHLINAICMDKSNEEVKHPLKKKVEHILTRQGFGNEEFFLDSLPNCIAMEAQWHGDLDTYGSFCITVPLNQITDITTTLINKNHEWDFRAKSDPWALRGLDIEKDPFVVLKYALLVLRPELFLPNGRPLVVNTNRVLRAPGGPSLTQSERSSWVLYYSDPQLPFLIDSSGHSLFEFDLKSLRSPKDSPSVFSLLVNANSKLQSIRQRTDNAVLSTYIYAVKAVVDLIFHVPKQVHKQAMSPVPPVPSLLPAQSTHHTNITPGPSTKPHGDGGGLQGQNSMDSGPQASGVVAEDHSNLDIGFEEPDYNPEEDDEPDAINGLTFSEMETVLQRASDGGISDRERADAAMLMLGMAGGHQRPQALSPLIEDYVV